MWSILNGGVWVESKVRIYIVSSEMKYLVQPLIRVSWIYKCHHSLLNAQIT